MDKKNKIAIVVYCLKKGGLERVVSNQTFMFTNLGFDVDLFVLENELHYPYKANLKVYNMKPSDNLVVKFSKYKKLKNDILKEKYDFILDHRYRLNYFMETIWLKYIYGKRDIIYMVHNSTLERYINPDIASTPNLQFISVSRGIEAKMKTHYPNSKIKTIYNVVELQNKVNVFEEINDEYILAVGRMASNNVKQFDVLIDCYSKSILPKKNIKFLILGSGDLFESLKSLVLELNLQNMVVFKGNQADLFTYYEKAKYLVLASKNEGLPTVLIESLVCGTPVISYDCESGPNEIIQDRYNGLLIENQNKQQLINAMNLFIEDNELYYFCKMNSKKSAQKFSENQVGKQWLNYFSDTQ